MLSSSSSHEVSRLKLNRVIRPVIQNVFPDKIAAPVSGGSIEFGEAADECNPNADTDTCTLALYFF